MHSDGRVATGESEAVGSGPVLPHGSRGRHVRARDRRAHRPQRSIPRVFPRRGLAGHFRMGSPLQLVGKSQLFAATRTSWGYLPTPGS